MNFTTEAKKKILDYGKKFFEHNPDEHQGLFLFNITAKMGDVVKVDTDPRLVDYVGKTINISRNIQDSDGQDNLMDADVYVTLLVNDYDGTRLIVSDQQYKTYKNWKVKQAKLNK